MEQRQGGRQGRPDPCQARLFPRPAYGYQAGCPQSRSCWPWKRSGVPVEVHHHEVATAGQTEIDLRYGTLHAHGRQLMIYKYMAKNVARQNGLTATFMPKPLFEDNGSGMHVHQSLWKGDNNVFFDEAGYAQLSDTAKYYIGGLLKHAPALLAIAAPTTNSYRRLVPGFEAPVNLAYSQRNRSAVCRIPVFNASPKAKRIEFRAPDPSCKPVPVLCRAADGRPGRRPEPDRSRASRWTRTSMTCRRRRSAEIKQVPGSLGAVLDALEADHEFLLKGDVFTPDLLEAYIAYKRRWKSTRCACARIRTSLRCTMTSSALRRKWRPGTGQGRKALWQLGDDCSRRVGIRAQLH